MIFLRVGLELITFLRLLIVEFVGIEYLIALVTNCIIQLKHDCNNKQPNHSKVHEVEIREYVIVDWNWQGEVLIIGVAVNVI